MEATYFVTSPIGTNSEGSLTLLLHFRQKKKGDVPTLTKILHMRSDVNSAYTYFANTILPKIVSLTKWRGQVTKRTISQIATPTDKAFGLLLLENSWENWIKKE